MIGTTRDRPHAVSAALIAKLCAGSPIAAVRLERALRPVINGSALYYARCYEALETDDIVQQTWLALIDNDFRLLRAYEPGRASLDAYVRGIVHNTARGYWRRHGKPRREAGTMSPGSIAELIGDESTSLVERLIAMQFVVRLRRRLEARHRRALLVFESYYIEGRKPVEIAADFAWSVQVVYNWTHQIKIEAKQLAEEINREAE